LQSLALLNSPFIRDRAKSLGQRLQKEAGADQASRLQRAFRLACGRPPNAEEMSAADRFLAAQRKEYGALQGGEEGAWADLCQMVLASNAFLYVE